MTTNCEAWTILSSGPVSSTAACAQTSPRHLYARVALVIAAAGAADRERRRQRNSDGKTRAPARAKEAASPLPSISLAPDQVDAVRRRALAVGAEWARGARRASHPPGVGRRCQRERSRSGGVAAETLMIASARGR